MPENLNPNNFLIVHNRKASFHYELFDRYEAGVSLLGWEVKASQKKRVGVSESYVILKNAEAFWVGGSIQPLASTFPMGTSIDSHRSRKLLLHRSELRKLFGLVHRKGFTLIPTRLYWKNRKIKLEFAIAKGKKQVDKREALKAKDWKRSQEQLLKNKNKSF